jgi:hypothetical protein
MADKRETYAGLLNGDQIGKTITVPDRDGDLVVGPVRVIVHQPHDVVAVFLEGETMPRMIAAGAIAVVS